MGISTALFSIHDDTAHQGSAKREIASGIAGLNAATLVIKNPASKGAASGIAELDAASELPLAQLKIHGSNKHDSTVPYSKYTNIDAGNNSLNRAIAHGLGKMPLLALLIRNDGFYWLQISGGIWMTNYIAELTTCTAMDTTNIYVGISAAATQTNNSANTYELMTWG